LKDGRVCYVRKKTGKSISFPLNDISAKIVEKYASPFGNDRDYIFPILDAAVHRTEQQKRDRIRKTLKKSRVKDAGRNDRIGNAIDYLCGPSYLRHGVEKVRRKRSLDFRIAGSFRFIDHPNLFGFFRE
jgi:hypothetical protein